MKYFGTLMLSTPIELLFLCVFASPADCHFSVENFRRCFQHTRPLIPLPAHASSITFNKRTRKLKRRKPEVYRGLPKVGSSKLVYIPVDSVCHREILAYLGIASNFIYLTSTSETWHFTPATGAACWLSLRIRQCIVYFQNEEKAVFGFSGRCPRI